MYVSQLSACHTPTNINTLVFDPTEVFRTLYQQYCLKAVHGFNGTPLYQCKLLEDHMVSLFPFMESRLGTAAQLHRDNLKPRQHFWSQLKSNHFCLYCLRQKPEYVLTCGHSTCDNCIRTFGTEIFSTNHRYIVESCVLCGSGSLTVVLKPHTAGVRILSIDGGGTRGVIPLEFLGRLQNDIGLDYPVQDLFDMAFGTSSGMYIYSTKYACTNNAWEVLLF